MPWHIHGKWFNANYLKLKHLLQIAYVVDDTIPIKLQDVLQITFIEEPYVYFESKRKHSIQKHNTH